MDTTVTNNSSGTTVRGQGRLRLKPLPGSVNQSTIEVSIDLHHAVDRLAIGDLRVRAQQASNDERFEEAYRLWSAVKTAAERASFGDLAVRALSEADGAQHRAQFLDAVERRTPEREPDRSTTKYDYELLAADVEGGLTKKATAEKHGCSPSTVQRAVDYVNERDELLDDAPEVLDQLMAGVDIAEIARRYGVETKVLRWMVSTNYDRRRG